MRFGNSPGVRRELAEGLRSLPGWCKGVRQKKTETHRKIVEGSQNTCRERCSVILPKFARRFTEGIGKLAGNMPGDRWKKTERLTARMPEDVGLVGGTTFAEISTSKPSVNDRCTAVAHAFGQLTAVDPPRLRDSTACTQESGYFRWLTCPYPSVRAAKSPRSTGE
ncbi:hypothetical protein BHM03_00020856 [Ensete ventricosum]|nr:hypothetical protein BHM03_00020856 [Ensete ventricosum]